MTGIIEENLANAEKFKRLREQQFISEDNQVNIMVVNGAADEFFESISEMREALKKQFVDYALEYAQTIFSSPLVAVCQLLWHI